MTRTQIFPAVMCVLSFGASFVYALDSDWRRAVYWLAAVVLTASVSL